MMIKVNIKAIAVVILLLIIVMLLENSQAQSYSTEIKLAKDEKLRVYNNLIDSLETSFSDIKPAKRIDSLTNWHFIHSKQSGWIQQHNWMVKKSISEVYMPKNDSIFLNPKDVLPPIYFKNNFVESRAFGNHICTVKVLENSKIMVISTFWSYPNGGSKSWELKHDYYFTFINPKN